MDKSIELQEQIDALSGAIVLMSDNEEEAVKKEYETILKDIEVQSSQAISKAGEAYKTKLDEIATSKEQFVKQADEFLSKKLTQIEVLKASQNEIEKKINELKEQLRLTLIKEERERREKTIQHTVATKPRIKF